MTQRQVEIGFSGGVWATFGYSILYAILAAFMIPAAWGATALFAWWTGKLRFADGTRAAFEGRGGQIWVLFAVLVFLGYLPEIARAVAQTERATTVHLLLTVLLLPLVAAVRLPVYRWAIENIRLDPGGRPRLTASYAGYLGWTVLLAVSLVTIIGWAWVAVAMIRWFCRHTEGDGFTVAFDGTGWGLLWRAVVWIACSILIIPIPWLIRWMYDWFTSNLVLIREDELGYDSQR